MQAYVFKDVGVLEAEEFPTPTAGPDEALVQPVSVGICGSDIHGFAGESGRRSPGQVMGHEFSGRIVEPTGVFSAGDPVVVNPLVGCEQCKHCRAGQPQRCPDRYVIGSNLGHDGGFADLVRVPLTNVHRLPESVPVALGALAEPLAVAVHAVRRAGVREGDVVGIVGAGPIGQSLVLAALWAGASSVRVAELDTRRREAAEQLGAVDRSELDGAVDVAFDAVGNEVTLDLALGMTAPGATVCLAGMSAGRVGLNAFAVSADEREVVGTFCYTPTAFAEALELLGSLGQSAERLVACSIPRDDLPEMMVKLGNGHLPVGKVLVQS